MGSSADTLVCRVMSGEFENAGERGPGGKEK